MGSLISDEDSDTTTLAPLSRASLNKLHHLFAFREEQKKRNLEQLSAI